MKDDENQKKKPRAPVIAAVVHDVLRLGGPYDRLADLAADVKTICALRRIPYDGARITEALRLVARSRPLIQESYAHEYARRMKR